MEECRIPKTATRRGAISYAKLLSRVDANAHDIYGFEGKLLRPGQVIAESELHGNAILLECTDIEGVHDQGSRHYRNRRKWDKVYILWRYERETRSWVEIVRTQCLSDEWAHVLREPARIALGRVSWAVIPSVADTVTAIMGYAEKHLRELEDDNQWKVLCELQDQFASWIVNTDAASRMGKAGAA
jgi:hypothetical protein